MQLALELLQKLHCTTYLTNVIEFTVERKMGR